MNERDTILRWGAVAAAVVLLVFLLLSLADVLNPVLLYLALAGVLLPLRRTEIFVPLMVAAGALVLVWLLREMGFLLAPFVLAVVLAYILNPLVGWLSARRPFTGRRAAGGRTPASGLPGRGARTLAVLALALPVVGGVIALIVWGVPYLLQEANELARRSPEMLERLGGFLRGLEEQVARIRLPGFEGSEAVARVEGVGSEDVVAFFQERGAAIRDWLWTGALGVGRGVGTVFSLLGYLVLAPILTFYVLRDYDRLAKGIDELIPPERRGLREGLAEYDRLLSSYLRGQLTVSLTVGALTAVGLLLVQFPYALLLGAIVAIFNVVPYLGLVLSLIPAMGIALTTGEPGIALLKMGVVYTVAQILESAVISPRIVGESTGLHPVWILLAITMGGLFFGFVGLLIAVPAAVGVKLLLVQAVAGYRASSFYGGVRTDEAG